MQQRYSTARAHEQESAIARVIDLSRITQRIREGKTNADGQRRWDSTKKPAEGSLNRLISLGYLEREKGFEPSTSHLGEVALYH